MEIHISERFLCGIYLGIRGDQVLCNMFNRLRQALDKRSYDFVIILAGTNDYINLIAKSEKLNYRSLIRMGYKPTEKLTQDQISNIEKERADIFKHIIDLHKLSHEHNISTMLLTIPEIKFEANMEYSDYVKQRKILNTDLRNFQHAETILVDLDKQFPFFKLNKDERVKLWLEDGLHFTSAGYDKVGDIIHNQLHKRI